MNVKFVLFALVVSACFAFVGHANMYNDWAQNKAVNLMCDIDPICSIGKAFVPSKKRIRNMETALNRDPKALLRPNVDLISANEILNYPYVDRYLSEQLGDKNDITHYYILREDYEFKTLSGESITIPAGFIWDGASIPSHRSGTWKKPIESAKNGLIELGLEGGNTRYSSALAEGLIHDYMYRDPRRFSKEDADDLLYVNLVRCGNANPIAIYEGVHVAGGDSYQGHKIRQDQGLYDVFTDEFYSRNKAVYQSCRASHKPEVFDPDSQCKKKDQLEEKVCHANSVAVNEFKTTDSADANRVNLTGKVDADVGSKRKICACVEPDTFFAGVVMVQIIKSKKPSAQYYCRKCGGFRRGDMFDVIQTGNGFATYPANVLPSDWDGKVYEKAELDEHVKNLLSDSDNSLKTTKGK